ncbi:mitochondrial genome maintenance MGM101 [Piedraia hortae CBS 480.64]|uniref:Mitochondrial genome maintenance protein MGM101 n=1 Tax=Piedraia hortae CBS 480.64 TaxID=1314780 RepID=A0A6A7C9B6_9PEZI|nr:mitochondrial genome maintenance MGM101 [Piedraia hortae CBS 480.64]
MKRLIPRLPLRTQPFYLQRAFQSTAPSQSRSIPTPPTTNPPEEVTPDLTTTGLSDSPAEHPSLSTWSDTLHGLSSTPFPPEVSQILQTPVSENDIEIKPDGIIYLPEIKYRRILNKAFGPGGWGLIPRTETIITPKLVTREYALVCSGRLVSIARGEQQYFDKEGVPTATEGCKSNALMRCCKDLGIASELWDPRFVREFKKKFAREVFVEHVTTKKRRKHWMRKDEGTVQWPLKEVTMGK